MRRAAFASLALCGLLASASCANLNSVNHSKRVFGRGQIHFIDAKQRAVLVQQYRDYARNSDGTVAVENGRPLAEYSAFRFCSEPPADTFSVIGYSLAAQLNGVWPGGGSAQSKNLKAEIAQSLSESGATIERTQTINLLRESMFRTCERYMNGALDDEEFVIQAARDQRAMVAILAIEQLTGVVRPAPTVLVSSGGSTVTSDPEAIAEQLSKALDGKVAAKSDHDKAAEKLKTMESNACKAEPEGQEPAAPLAGSSAPAPVEAAEDDEEAVPIAQMAQPEEACAKAEDITAQKQAVEKTAEALAEATEYYETIKSMAASIGSAAAWSRAGGESGGGGEPASLADRTAVAKAVERIVEGAFRDESELTFVCMAVLRRAKPKDGEKDALRDSCGQLIGAQVENEVSKLSKWGERYLAEANSQFEKFLNKVQSNGAVDLNLIESALIDAGVPSQTREFFKTEDIDKLRREFGLLSRRERQLLEGL